MASKCCSDVVESRVEHAILDTESGRNAAFSSVSEQPRRANLRGTRGLLTTTRCDERALSIDQFGDLSIASSTAANACHEFVRMEPVANPDSHADLWRSPDLHRLDMPALMPKKYHV
jgi:hypothetical protein